jgi:hypothetical protein
VRDCGRSHFDWFLWELTKQKITFFDDDVLFSILQNYLDVNDYWYRYDLSCQQVNKLATNLVQENGKEQSWEVSENSSSILHLHLKQTRIISFHQCRHLEHTCMQTGKMKKMSPLKSVIYIRLQIPKPCF